MSGELPEWQGDVCGVRKREFLGTCSVNMFVIDHEVSVRLGFFFGILAVMALWEVLAPRRPLTTSKGARWFTNLTITFANSALLRVVFPTSAAGVAMWAQTRGWGLFSAMPFGGGLAGVASVLLLDLLIYAQHVSFHHIPLFWRLHKMHHTDLDLDVTSGARFHPAEIVLSMVIKTAAIVALGAPAWAVIVFEVVLNGTAMFNHSNIRIPLGLDRIVRMLVVTPDMHRVHHSVIIRETNSNFGFNFPWWDRIFGTYRDQPAAGHDGMRIGLANFRNPAELSVLRLLAIPLDKRER
jgi:sterol desaturase/sphingolipid hydroxylase (fatty acid hydroxylase superfamily)